MPTSALYLKLESESDEVVCFLIKYEFVYVVGSSVLFRIYARVSICIWCCSELCMTGNKLTVLAFRRVRKIAKSDCKLCRACSSVRMEQHGDHWTEFHEISDFSIFRKPVEKIKFSLKSVKNNGYIT